ncbi:MAG TPA: hypothetical protein VNV41_11025, partial [Candidatus Acidoferrales bacterium]|nr:hypothetical protein [Candidatus Acidoferrales bacterium]
ARLARIDPPLLGPVRHRSAQAHMHLTVIRARAALVSTRTALVNAVRELTKSHGQRLRKCGTEQMNREMAQGLSQELGYAARNSCADIGQYEPLREAKASVQRRGCPVSDSLLLSDEVNCGSQNDGNRDNCG